MWKDLSMREKAALMQVAVKNGIYGLEEIRNSYNSFAEGGPTKGYTDEEIEEDIRRGREDGIIVTSKDERLRREMLKKAERSKLNNIEGGSNPKVDKEVNLVMNAMTESTKSPDKFGIKLAEAKDRQDQERIDKWSEYKRGIDATMTAAELLSAGYLLGGAAKAHNLLPNTRIINGLYASDKGQIMANTVGGIADGYQLLTDDSPWSRIENGTETLFNTAGAIGGTNVVRNSRWFGRYGNKIDNILDGAGITASIYDLGKGAYNLYDWLFKEENK